MAWIESHEELLSHPKSKRLKRRLNVTEHEVVGILHYFWHWAVKFAEDGCITKFSAEDIADAIRFEGDAEMLLQALIDSGFVDEEDGERHIHDWYDYAGKLIVWRQKEADRLKQYRTNKKERSTKDKRTPYEPSTNTVRTPVYSNSNSKSNKEKNTPPQFDEFWSVFPRKISKQDAIKAWAAVLKDGTDPSEIIKAAQNYATDCKVKGTETQYIKHPATFLRSDRWKDYLQTIIPNTSKSIQRPELILIDPEKERLYAKYANADA